MAEKKHYGVSSRIAISIIIVVTCIEHEVKAQHSPCPDIFTYESKREEDRWFGTVLLQSDEELFSIWIDIILDRKVELVGNWFGEVSTTDNQQFTITNRNKRLLPNNKKYIRFFVKYEHSNVPNVESIRLNGKTICSNRKTTNPPHRVTTESTSRTSTEQIFFVNSQNSYEDNSYDRNRPSSVQVNKNSMNNINHGNSASNNGHSFHSVSRPSSSSGFTSTTRRSASISEIDFNTNGFVSELNPTRRPIKVTHRPQESNNFDTNRDRHQCGVASVQARPLITRGVETIAGQWPWHAALYRSEGIDLKYICGGSLVSRRHIITAAHCVTINNSRRVINPSSFMLYLGKYNFTKWTNIGLQNLQVEKIVVHPEFNATNFDCDIAILTLAKNVEITDYVRPVCLWEGSTDLSSIVDREGTVVGWGYDEEGKVTEQLMQARMPVVSQQTCIYSHPDFFSRFTSIRTYCAGFRNGTSVCNGDSGGGMVFSRPQTNPPVWQLRGIVSISVALQNVCDSHHYAVFTDAAKHKSWIEGIVDGR